MIKEKVWMRCCNIHWVKVGIKELKGRRYWICPLCNIVHGLPKRDSISFTGLGDREWRIALQKKLEKEQEKKDEK